ncbi:MAG TPA: 50S ribosomal protein L28 [Armatimonadota bacterium]|nr:50S ribosomal protein L28 [Armatimonadota bacterium]
MSRVCEYCGKGSQFGNNIRHVHSGQWALRAPKTKKAWRPNIQTARVLKNGITTRVRVCTRCMKAGKVVRAAAPQPQ